MYQVWEREEQTLVAQFPSQEEAIEFLRGLIRPLELEGAVRRLDQLQLVRAGEESIPAEVIAEGGHLVGYLFGPQPMDPGE